MPETTSKASNAPPHAHSAPVILSLEIQRFRGIEALSWRPRKGVNIILGGGDTGKTTILEAIALLLSPANPTMLAESDYHARDVRAEFSVTAVVELPAATNISRQLRPSWPWEWDGLKPVVPSISAEEASESRPVYCLRVRGTEELELLYEIVQPDGTTAPLSVSLRRAIGLVRLSSDDRNDRDLRLVQGSALDRLLSDPSLRSRLSSSLNTTDVKGALLKDRSDALVALDTVFENSRLPSGLDLSITGGQGVSIAALVGLTAKRSGVQLPLATWGAGTRRLAALKIAAQNQAEGAVVVVDEIERGLEPYRQRILMETLQTTASQTFITTHSPSALSAATSSALWYLDPPGTLGPLEGSEISSHLATDPEAFLSVLTLVAEGLTEVGFVTFLLEKALGTSLRHNGIHVADGGGHEKCLELLKALAAAGLRFGGFVDNEGGKHREAWARLGTKLGPLLFRWKEGCLEANLVRALPDDRLEEFLLDPEDEETGARLRTLADRLELAERTFPAIWSKAGSGLRDVIVAAATGSVPPGIEKKEQKKEYKSHAQHWFKNRRGGAELATKMFVLGAWPTLMTELLPFCNAVRRSVRLAEVTDIS